MIVAGLVAFAISQIVVGGFIFGAVAASAAAERRAEQMRPKLERPDPTVDIERYANCPHHPAWGTARHVEGRVR